MSQQQQQKQTPQHVSDDDEVETGLLNLPMASFIAGTFGGILHPILNMMVLETNINKIMNDGDYHFVVGADE